MLHNVRTHTLLCLFISFLSLSAVAQDLTDADKHFARGEEYLQKQKYTEAIEEFKEAIRIRPRWPEAYFKLGLAYSAVPLTDRNADYETAALKAFKEAVRLKPDWAEAHNQLGSKYRTFLRYDEAIKSIKEAIRLKSDFAEAHENLGIAYLYTGRYSEGVESLKEAIRLQPNLALSHEMLGLAYLALDDRQKAVEQYDLLKPLDQKMASYLGGKIKSGEKPTFGVTRGRALNIPEPKYPESAKANRISGVVTVEIMIDEEGRVISASAIDGPFELRKAAEDAAMKARFAPTKISGTPIKIKGRIDYNFSP